MGSSTAGPTHPDVQVRKLLEQLPLGVFLIQSDVITYANRALGARLERDASKLSGVAAASLLARDWERRLVGRLLAGAPAVGVAFRRVLQVRRGSGEVVPMEVEAVAAELEGAPVVLGIARPARSEDRSDSRGGVVEAEGELDRYARRLRVLHDIDQALLEARSPEEIVREAVTRAGALLAFERANVLLFDHEGGIARVLVDVDGAGRDAGDAGRTLPLGSFDLEHVNVGEVRRVDDVRRLPQPSERDRAILSEGITSYVSLPMVYRGDLIGLLNFGHGRARAFSGSDIDVGREVAAQLAVTLVQAAHREATEAAEQRYRGLFEGVPVGLFRSTREGRILEANAALVAMLGFGSAEEVRRLNALDFWADPEARDRFLRRLDRKGVLRDHEFRLRRADGRLIWASLNGRVVRDEHGSVLYYEGSCEDITEQKALEERLRHAQKLEAMGRLAGGIAHDFHNIMSAIRGNADLLLERTVEEALRDPAREIDFAVERATALTRHLLAFSRRQALRRELVDLNLVVTEAMPLLRHLMGAIEIRLVLQPSRTWVRADRAQLEQVVLNLAVNARDAMPAGGRLTLRTSRLRLRSARSRAPHLEPGDYVVLTVADTGIGMKPEVRERIFEPFFTTKEAGKGTGLGLSTVYGVVRQSGGHLEVASRPGRGTRFRILLPRARGTLRPRPGRRASRPQDALEGRGSETVLVVDDDAPVRRIVRAILTSRGYRVLEAESVEDALAVAAAASGDVIHLLLTDLSLPEGGPGRLARGLRQAGRSFRVLRMSGHPREYLLHSGALEADAAFIEKPFSPRELARAVRRVLEENG